MTSMTPRALVTGAPHTPLPYGLFSVFAPRTDQTSHWENGITWETFTCAPAEVIGGPSCEPLDAPKTFDTAYGERGEADAFTVYGRHVCSPIGNGLGHAEEMARLHLARREEQAVERKLWETLSDLPQPSGVSASIDEWSYMSGGVVLEAEGRFSRDYGGVGVLHISRELLTPEVVKLLEFRGGRAYTKLGTPVILGSGYAPEGFALTAPLFGLRSEVFTSSNRAGDLLDRSQNDLYGIAERVYAVGFDPCGALHVRIDDTPIAT